MGRSHMHVLCVLYTSIAFQYERVMLKYNTLNAFIDL